jgi:hypothetical protein
MLEQRTQKNFITHPELSTELETVNVFSEADIT